MEDCSPLDSRSTNRVETASSNSISDGSKQVRIISAQLKLKNQGKRNKQRRKEKTVKKRLKIEKEELKANPFHLLHL